MRASRRKNPTATADTSRSGGHLEHHLVTPETLEEEVETDSRMPPPAKDRLMPTRKRQEKRPATTRAYMVYYLPDEEAGGYTVHIPALGIVTEGETLEEARAMAKDAIDGRIAALQELGQSIPDDVLVEHIAFKPSAKSTGYDIIPSK